VFKLRLATGPRPVPDKFSICGLPGAVSLIAIFAMREPPALGVKVMLRLQLLLAPKELAQALFRAKFPLLAPTMPILDMPKAALPVFTSITVAGMLLTPIACGAKFTRIGDAVRNGPLTPIPLSGIASGLIRVLSVIVTAPDCGPVEVGENVTVTVQWAPIARLAPQSLVWLKLPFTSMRAMLKLTLLWFPIVMV